MERASSIIDAIIISMFPLDNVTDSKNLVFILSTAHFKLTAVGLEFISLSDIFSNSSVKPERFLFLLPFRITAMPKAAATPICNTH